MSIVVAEFSDRVDVEVSVSRLPEQLDGDVTLRWWPYRTCARVDAIPEAFVDANPTTTTNGQVLITPMMACEADRHVCCLTLPRSGSPPSAPFYVGLNCTYDKVGGGGAVSLRPPERAHFSAPISIPPGTPYPLGVYRQEAWANFALVSAGPDAPSLVLCSGAADGGNADVALEIELDPLHHRTGDVWSARVQVPRGCTMYGVSFGNARSGLRPDLFSDSVAPSDRGALSLLPDVRGPPEVEGWAEDAPLLTPLGELKIFEVDFKSEQQGGCAGQADVYDAVRVLADELKGTGINAFMVRGKPAKQTQTLTGFPFLFSSKNTNHDNTMRAGLLHEDTLTGVAFASSGCGGGGGIAMKALVRDLHAWGVELILQLDCLKALEAIGCEHLNEPLAKECLRQSLRYLVQEYHLDGLSFFHAEKLTHGDYGAVLDRPPIVEDMACDPCLDEAKLIAVPCGSHLLPREGLRGFPHWGRWAELHERFATNIGALYETQRSAPVDGEAAGGGGGEGPQTLPDEASVQGGDLAQFAMRLTGSADLFQRWEEGGSHLFEGRSPAMGLNAASPLGAPPAAAAGNAGDASEGSDVRWALIAAAFVAQGVPVVRLADLSESNWPRDIEILTRLCRFREAFQNLIQQESFETPRDLRWHATDAALEPAWSGPAVSGGSSAADASAAGAPPPVEGPSAHGNVGSRFLGLSLWDGARDSAVYAAFNGNAEASGVEILLPQPAPGCGWFIIFDSGDIGGSLAIKPDTMVHIKSGAYTMQPRSALLLTMGPL